MDEIITCPAPLGMLRLGSVVSPPSGGSGVVNGVYPDRICVAFLRNLGWDDIDVADYDSSRLAMNLSDETGEQHAVSWCAERLALAEGYTSEEAAAARRGASLNLAGDGDLWWLMTNGGAYFSLEIASDVVEPVDDDDRRRAVAALVEGILAGAYS